MKTNFLTLPVVLLAISAILAAIPRATAQVDATSWTSVEGTTIWARLDGLEGNHVVLNMRGKTYRVPLNRLAPKSVEKARRLLNLPAKTRKTAPIASRAKPKIDIPERCVRETTPLIVEVEDETPVNGDPSPEMTPENPEAALPEFSESPAPAEEYDQSVLPERDAMQDTYQFPDSSVRLTGRLAIASAGLPSVIRAMIEAGNRLQTKTYKWGGGRAQLEDTGYDCSGSVSYVLIKAGLLESPITSGSFTRYGAPGSGRWITIHARHGHVFMTVCGLRLDTGGHGGRGESGPRWCTHMRGTSGFVMRHPPGL